MRALAVLILLAFTSNLAVAAPPSPETYRKEEGQIPSSPTTPPALSRPETPATFLCERTFVYKGKALTCDSNVQQDAEKMRSVFSDTPEALDDLNTYQRNRRNLKNVAYFASLGLATMMVGFLIDRPPIPNVTIRNGGYLALAGAAISLGSIAFAISPAHPSDNHLTKAATILGIGIATILAGYLIDHPAIEGGEIKPGGYIVLGGLGLTIGSVAYSLSLSRNNDSYLHGAVQEFNKAHPNQPIELQFNTGIKF